MNKKEKKQLLAVSLRLPIEIVEKVGILVEEMRCANRNEVVVTGERWRRSQVYRLALSIGVQQLQRELTQVRQ
jgi:hypothetical protein